MIEPYYRDNSVTIYHGDALEILPELDLDAQLFCMDPPYFGVVDHDWDRQWQGNPVAFLEWIGEVLDLCSDALADNGTIAVFASPDMAGGVETEMRDRFDFLNHIVWDKPGVGQLGKVVLEDLRSFVALTERILIAEAPRLNHLPYRSQGRTDHRLLAEAHAPLIKKLIALRDRSGVTNKAIDEALGTNGMAGHYFGRSQWELPTPEAWQIIVDLFAPTKCPSWIYIRNEWEGRHDRYMQSRRPFSPSPTKDRRLMSDIWRFPRASKPQHPTQKPIEIMRHLIGVLSRPGDLVVDAFMGSGTTLRAAKDLGRRAIGIELDERYCEIAVVRLAQGSLYFPPVSDVDANPDNKQGSML